ncbi:MAG: WG repeat-containing protein, partial [Clostridia bacterium]|nr:WG repeat-containing protein [Clostridia bacterium]
MKKVVVAIIIVLILVLGIFFAVGAIKSSNKNYDLEEISEKDYKYFAVYTDEKYGVVDETGKMIIQNEYLDITIPNPTKAVFICQKSDGTLDILNEKNEKIFTNFANVSAIETNGTNSSWPYEKSVLRFEKDGKFGLINFEGKAITKPKYEEISSVKYKEDEILAKKDGRFGVLNNTGTKLI